MIEPEQDVKIPMQKDIEIRNKENLQGVIKDSIGSEEDSFIE